MTFGDPGGYMHFGIYSNNSMLPAFDVHTDPKVEYEVLLDLGGAFPSVKGFVSGSWACWGPADQATDGDQSLHLVLDVTESLAIFGSYSQLVRIWLAQYLVPAINNGVPQYCRLLDHAIVTSEDHSEVKAVVQLSPAHLFSVDQKVF